MNYEEFKIYVEANIKSELSERFENAEVSIQEITKNNNLKLDGLTIKLPNTNIAPTIYLNYFWDKLSEGDITPHALSESVKEIMRVYEENIPSQNLDVSQVTDWNNVKDRIFVTVSNLDKNFEKISTCPHFIKEDLLCTYKILMSSTITGSATVSVTNALLDKMHNMDISIDQLKDLALENTKKLLPVEITSLGSMMKELLSPGELFEVDDIPRNSEMYVVTNDLKLYGATAIMYDDILSQISQTIGGDFYILPSSIHETLAIGTSASMSISELEDMVREVNRTQVCPEEVLSDNIYHYDAMKKTFELVGTGKELNHKNEIGRITRNLKQAGIQPNVRVVKNIQDLNHLKGTELSVDQIKSLPKDTKFMEDSNNQKLVKSINKDLQALDLSISRKKIRD